MRLPAPERSVIAAYKVIAMCLVATLLAACGDSNSEAQEPGSVGPEPGPIPQEMCPGGWPVAAAYELETGGFEWVACSPDGGLFLMAAASEDVVWVELAGAVSEFWAFDAETGEELWRGDESRFDAEVPADADVPVETPPLIDDVQLGGGQDEQMTGTDASTGEMLWTQPGNLLYGDVWPVGDGAVFATEDETTYDLVGYEVATGDVRWRRNLTEPLGPWHVIHDDRLLAMWNNLEVVATDDGTVLWRTEFPKPVSGFLFPRMFGGLANTKSVFVSFTSVASGGD